VNIQVSVGLGPGAIQKQSIFMKKTIKAPLMFKSYGLMSMFRITVQHLSSSNESTYHPHTLYRWSTENAATWINNS